MIPLQMAFRDKHPVTRIAFSPDQVAVAQPHCGVTLLERGTGRTVAVCPMPRRNVLTGLAFTGDGRLLVAASAKGLSVFDATTGTRLGHSGHRPHCALALATTVAGVRGADRECRTREWTAAQFLNAEFSIKWPGGPAPGKALALDPGGRHILFAVSPTEAGLYDLVSQKTVAKFDLPAPTPGAFAPLPGAAFCPLGRRFALSDGRTLDVYDAAELPGADEDEDEQLSPAPLVQLAQGTQQTAAAPAPHAVLSVAFSLRSEKPGAGEWRPPFALFADGRGLLVKRPRNRVQLWDALAGALLNEWSWQLEWVTCLAVSPDGLTAVAGGRFGRVLLWDLD